jgi:hypothetical protein
VARQAFILGLVAGFMELLADWGVELGINGKIQDYSEAQQK